MVARAPVLSLCDACGTGLYKTEWNVCSDEHMPVEAGADQWIHIVCRLLHRTCNHGQYCRKESQ